MGRPRLGARNAQCPVRALGRGMPNALSAPWGAECPMPDGQWQITCRRHATLPGPVIPNPFDTHCTVRRWGEGALVAGDVPVGGSQPSGCSGRGGTDGMRTQAGAVRIWTYCIALWLRMVFDWKQQLQFYADWYNREHDRSDQITASLAIPVSLLTALGAGIAYLLNNRPGFSFAPLNVLAVYLLLLLTALFLGLAGWFLYRALFPRDASFKSYKFFPLPHEIRILREQIELRVQSKDGEGEPGDLTELRRAADEFYYRELIRRFEECIDHNAVVNQVRSRARYRGLQMTILAAGFLALSSLPFFL